jgi:uncharacterized repeat protein (TIGR03803 family)
LGGRGSLDAQGTATGVQRIGAVQLLRGDRLCGRCYAILWQPDIRQRRKSIWGHLVRRQSRAQCGTYGCGTVFRISPTGVLATLYAFCSQSNCSDGLFPSSLIQGADGNFYGVTEQGGSNTYQACGAGSGCGAGTVFRLTPSGVLTTLYSFCNQAACTDGAGPNAPPLQGSDGSLYGTTLSGGLSGCNGYGCGTVYKITPSGQLTTLYRFCNTTNCADGVGPLASLVEGPDGDFYGTTSGQYAGSTFGASDPGQTAFKITPTGTLTTLYTFCSQSNCTDGDAPASGLFLASDGNFYGTTNTGGADSSGCNGYGCGTVFKISPLGAFSTLYSFCDEADCTLGNQPQAVPPATHRLYTPSAACRTARRVASTAELRAPFQYRQRTVTFTE